MEALKVRPILVVVMIVVGMLVAMRTTSVTAKIRVMLKYGKIRRLRGWRRWMRQQR